MKKIDFKSVIIGCLVMTCMFLFIGQSNQTGRFGTIYANEIRLVGKNSDIYISDTGMLITNEVEATQTHLSSSSIAIIDEKSNLNSVLTESGLSVSNIDGKRIHLWLKTDKNKNGTLSLNDIYGSPFYYLSKTN